MDIKSHWILLLKKNVYIFVIVDHFSNSIVTVPTPKNVASDVVISLFQHWVSKFGCRQYLITEGGAAYLNTEFQIVAIFLLLNKYFTYSSDNWTCWSTK